MIFTFIAHAQKRHPDSLSAVGANPQSALDKEISGDKFALQTPPSMMCRRVCAQVFVVIRRSAEMFLS